VRKHKLEHQAVLIVAQAMTTDEDDSFQGSMRKMAGSGMSKRAAEMVYKAAGITAKDVQVIELHDCFSANELITYEALGLCPEGQAGKLIDSGDVTYGGKWVVNPSGGLISKGHPLGATGLAQCAEMCWQLRGMCGKRQVPNVKHALAHNIGLGGAAVVTLYTLGFPDKFKAFPAGVPNPATQDTREVKAVSAATEEWKSPQLLGGLAEKLKAQPGLVAQVNAVFQFQIKGPGGKTRSWTVDLKNPPGSVSEGSTSKADLTIMIDDESAAALLGGKANPAALFGDGKLKFDGDISNAMKLQTILKPTKSKL
jgi:sterol carrier protein 2